MIANRKGVRQCCQHPQEIEYEVRRTDPEEISVLE